MALIIKFMPNYFFAPDEFPEIPKRDDVKNDDFLFKQGATRGLSKIRFHDFNIAYNSVDLPNITVFKEQIEVFKNLLLKAQPNEEQIKDIDFLLILGELFTLVVYGQLIIENSKIYQIDDNLLYQIFNFIVRDFSKFSLQLYFKSSSTDLQMELCQKMIKKAAVNDDLFNSIWEKYVYPMNGKYEMNP